jgi:subtilisin family serine protease
VGHLLRSYPRLNTRRGAVGAVLAAALVGGLGPAALAPAGLATQAAKPAAASARPTPTPKPPPATSKHARDVLAQLAPQLAGRAPTAKPQSRAAAALAQGTPCYGDPRTVDQTPLNDLGPAPNFAPADSPNASFDAASFSLTYACDTQNWTLSVTTTDTWAPANLKNLALLINTDGQYPNGNNGCGFEFIARTLDGSVYPLTGNGTTCIFQPASGPASFTTASPTVTMTFPWSALTSTVNGVPNALPTSLEWFAFLSANDGSIDAVPDLGPVYDALPWPGTYPGCSSPNSIQQVASAKDARQGPAAAAALAAAGFGQVRQLSGGILTFAGDPARAHAVLAKAGVDAAVSPEQTYTTQAVRTGAALPPTPNDPQYQNSNQWSLLDTIPGVNPQPAWTITHGSPNVIVADIDTGIDGAHPDLLGKTVAGQDVSVSPPIPIPIGTNDDNVGHGTEVAGVIGATTNNGLDLASLGWDIKVMPIKASDTSSLPSSAIAAGIHFAADNGAKVINLSLGGPCADPVVANAIAYAQAPGRDVLVVASAGNGAAAPQGTPDGTPLYNYYSHPAADPGVLAVGALGKDGLRAFYSETGPYVGIVAPGGSAIMNATAQDLLLICPPGIGACPATGATPGIITGAGTSFSSPMVAAAAALVYSVQPAWSRAQVIANLKANATHLGVPTGSTGPSNLAYGAGGLNAGAAVVAANAVVPGALDHLVLNPANSTIQAGTSQAYTAAGADVAGNAVALVGTTTYTIIPNGAGTGATCTANSCGATKTGSYTVTATNSGKTGTATLVVTIGPLATVTLAPATASIAAGVPQAYTATGADSFANMADVTATTTFTIAPNGGITGATCTANQCTATELGSYTVTGTNATKTGTASLMVVPKSRPLIFRGGSWYLRNTATTGGADTTFAFGSPGDIPVTGDWTGTGHTGIGVFRNGTWYLRDDPTTGPAQHVFNFGSPGDVPVTGNWNGTTPVTGIGVFRNGNWYLRNTPTTGGAEYNFQFAGAGDVPVTGNWSGTQQTGIGVFRAGNWYLKQTPSTGVADLSFQYASPGDIPVTGDWDGNGTVTPGVVRNGTWYLRNANTTGAADAGTFTYGIPSDIPRSWHT